MQDIQRHRKVSIRCEMQIQASQSKIVCPVVDGEVETVAVEEGVADSSACVVEPMELIHPCCTITYKKSGCARVSIKFLPDQ